jgi:hypothetical protein
LNREYFVSDKYAARLLDRFAILPSDFQSRLERVLSSPGCDSAELQKSSELLNALWLETVELTAGACKRCFDLSLPFAWRTCVERLLPDEVSLNHASVKNNGSAISNQWISLVDFICPSPFTSMNTE